MVYVSYKNLIESIYEKLLGIGVRNDVARFLSDGICQNSLRGIDSHGIRLLPHYIDALNGGRLNKNPKYSFIDTSTSTGKLNGDHAPGYAAGCEAMTHAVTIAKKTGISAVSVHNSSHFGAAAFYALKAADQDMIGLSFTNATAHVLSYNGIRPFFGNNPICMCAPIKDEEPFCLDMATTVSTFNKIQKYKEEGKKIPVGWAVDIDGKDTTNPEKVHSLLPIGRYKGFGLSMMVDIFCSLLSGMPFGPSVTAMFDGKLNNKRQLGHFFVVIDIKSFQDVDNFKSRMKEMVNMVRTEPSKDPNEKVICPGDPEKKVKAIRLKEGMPVQEELWDYIINNAK